MCLNDIAMLSSSHPPLRCFVAMAFDHDDTDAVFKIIQATVKPLQIQAIRIDRVEHNDDIDDRIIREIKNADFTIADLTYARPSVYFEAGFAQRSVPVIYKVRSDHFNPRGDDPNGNLRVHFDLQMKNIIAWKDPTDKLFQKRLTSRIKKVIAPIVRSRALVEEAKAKAAQFAILSRLEQYEYLRKLTRHHFAKLRYTVFEVRDNAMPVMKQFISLGDPFRGAIVCINHNRDSLRFVFVHVVGSITKTLCQHYRFSLLGMLPYDIEGLHKKHTPVTRSKEDIVVCSFGTGGTARMAKEIPRLRPRNDGIMTYTETEHRNHKSHSYERHTTVQVIESTARLADLDEELQRRFAE